MTAPTPRYLYDLSDGDASMRSLLGGKGANIAEMMRLGVPVPDGFIVSTEACVDAMRSTGLCRAWRSAPAGRSAARTGPSWWRCAPEPSSRCPG